MYQSKSLSAARSVACMPSCRPRHSRYASWTFEELRQLAGQLQLPSVKGKTRRELLELLTGHPGD